MSGQEELEVDRGTVESRAPDRPPRVLLTNDDGIASPGLRRLAVALAEEHDVVVAAPAENMSGVGTSMGRWDEDEGIAMSREDIDGVEAYAVAGPPGLAVMAASLEAFGPAPDLVVSGINAGLNTGRSIIHSGTVGGALTAHSFGGRGVAISLAPSDPWHWDTAVPVAVDAARWALASRPRTVLNVNVPAVPAEQVRGTRWAELDDFGHFGLATMDRDARTLRLDVTDRSAGGRPEVDTSLCLDGWVTLTPLEPVLAAPVPDVSPDDVVTSRRP